jgi:diadenosine tetraphosphate (Ap4A) HIT family hydrolase
MAPSSCRWCEIIEGRGTALVTDPAFVIVDPGQIGCADGNLTLVPRAHVSVLSELGSEDMAAVLAGLSRLLTAIKRASGATRVEVQAHPEHSSDPTHLHFHVVAEGTDATSEGALAAEKVLDIMETMSR